MSIASLGLALALLEPSSTERIRLEWDAPSECPDAAAMQLRIAALLEQDELGADAGLLARGRITTTPEGYVLELHVDGPHGSGERRLEARDCGELAQATALIIAVALDPATATEPTPETIEPPPTPTTPPNAPPLLVADDPVAVDASPPARSPADAVHSRDDLRVALRGGIGVDALLWRPVGLSTALGLGVIGRHWRVDFVARWAAPTIVDAPRAPSVRARVQTWSLGASACGVPTFARAIELPLCAGLELGAWHARGIGSALAPGRTTRALWIAAAVGPTLVWRFTRRLALWAALDAVVLLGRPDFVTDQSTRVLQPNWAGMRALVGLEFRSGR